MDRRDDGDIYSPPPSQQNASLQAAEPRPYPLVVVFFLALAATIVLSELYWIAVNIATPLVVVTLLHSTESLPGIYNLTSYRVLTAIPAALPDIYSGSIVARRCKSHPYYCLSAVYAAVLIYVNWGEQPISMLEFAGNIAIDFLSVAAACASLWYCRRRYQRHKANAEPI